MINKIGLSGVFFFASVSCALGVVFSLSFIPEIKNKSVTDLENLFNKKDIRDPKIKEQTSL